MGRRQIHKLSALGVKNLKIPGLYGDGGGLLLRVTRSGTKNWLFLYKRRDMGLGAYPAISLEEARQQAADARKQLGQGVNPIEARRTQPDAIKHISFSQACAAYVAAHSPAWRNAKHCQQWLNTLRDYAEPVIGKKDVREITADDCLRVLSPIWTDKPETASRLRGRMENVLDWCGAKGYRDRILSTPPHGALISSICLQRAKKRPPFNIMPLCLGVTFPYLWLNCENELVWPPARLNCSFSPAREPPKSSLQNAQKLKVICGQYRELYT